MANIGLELSGHKKGEYQFLEPHDDLNMSQSTNDSYPTAIKVAFLLRNDKLIAELQQLVASFRSKGNEFLEIPKMGRTELQDAVPMTVGQEFHAFAASLEGEIQLLQDAEKYLYARQHGRHGDRHRHQRAEGLRRGRRRRARQAHRASRSCPRRTCSRRPGTSKAFVVYSSALKSVAIKLSKIAGDLILLASGPRAGLGEINLPAMQPGSSIMPGKVNPVIPELINVIAFRVMGNDAASTIAAHCGQLQLNAYEPFEGLAIMESQHLLLNGLADAARASASTASRSTRRCSTRYMETTVGIVTALNPVIGYEKATELANEAYKSGKGLLEIIREKKVLTEAQIKDLLDPGEAHEPRSKPLPAVTTEPRSVPRTLSQENHQCAQSMASRPPWACSRSSFRRRPPHSNKASRTSSSSRPAARSPARPRAARRPATAPAP